MKTHFDRSLVDNTSESRAWLIGMTCIGVVLVLSLGGYQLVQQSASSQAEWVNPLVAATSPPVLVVAVYVTSLCIYTSRGSKFFQNLWIFRN